MGKVALILVAIATFTGLFVMQTSRQNVYATSEEVADHQHEILARNAALAGLQQAEQELADSFGGHTLSGSFDGSGYTTEAVLNGGRAVIHSVGTSRNAAGEAVRFNIRAEYKQFASPSGIAQEAPPFLGYAVLSDDELRLQGNILTDVCEICVDGTEDLMLNANMHTNDRLHVTGNSAEVRGFGTYVTSASSNPMKALNGTFDPYYNPGGSDPVQQAAVVDVPWMNIEDMADLLGADEYIDEDFTLGGALSYTGTRTNPYVIHVNGNLSCGGGATLDGYVILLVQGEVECTGNLRVGDSGYDGPDESSIALYAAGDVELGGNVEIWGQIVTNGDVWFHGTPDIYGTITARRGVNFAGNVNIFYRVASPAMTTYWNGDTVQRLRRLAYTEW